MTTEHVQNDRRAKSEQIAHQHFVRCSAGMMGDALSAMQKKLATRCGITACTSFATGANCLKCGLGRKQLGKGI